MNLGQIPGYYYDSEKQKYFKIQANHAAPTGAKYAKSSVKQEERKAKKRKVEDLELKKRLKQTVRRPRLLQNPVITGAALNRELGLQQPTTDLLQRDAAVLSQLQPSSYDLGDETLLDLIPFSGDRILFANGRGLGSIVSVVPNPVVCSGAASYRATEGRLFTRHPAREEVVYVGAFGSSVIGLHSITSPSDDLSTFVAVAQESSNVYIATLSPGTDRLRSANYLQIGTSDSSLWSSALRPTAPDVAVCGTENVCVVDAKTATRSHSMTTNETRDVTWLDPNTIAYGRHGANSEWVILWDVRTSGRSLRYHRKDLITGIHAPNRHGVQLLVSDNRRMDLYDTRMGKAALLSFPHVHQGPQLQFDVSYEGVVAALDAENAVQTYSLRSGRAVGPLAQSGGAGLMRKLRWLDEDRSGPILQACQGSSVVRWSWGGADGDGA